MNDYTYESRYLTKIFETSHDSLAEWFGYYNYDVLSSDGKRMLCNRAAFDGREITDEDTVELGYFDVDTGEWHHIAHTDSFNWQQGAMLQWLPGRDDTVVYNFSDKTCFKSCLHNIVTGEKRIIDFPVYGITPDGKYSVSLNYERSYWCRAYHYQPVKNPEYDVRVAEDDGIFLVDLEENTVKRIIDINDVLALNPDSDFGEAKHWLEHIMISPSGKRIVFLHRYSFGKAYDTRVIIADIDGTNLQALPGWKNFNWSHFGWRGDDSFVIYTVKRSNAEASYVKTMQKKGGIKKAIIKFVHRIAKMILPRKMINSMKANASYYQYYELENGKFVLRENLDRPLFGIDGHPSFTPDGAYMITDSYPDSEQYQRLMVYDAEKRRELLLGRFFAYYKGNPASCDLHPKLSRDGKYVAVDTAYSGLHNMILFEINWKEIKDVIN